MSFSINARNAPGSRYIRLFVSIQLREPPTLDHVTRQGIWRAAKADDGEAIVEVGSDLPDGLAYVTELCGAVSAESIDVRDGAHGIVDSRTFAVDELEVKSHRSEGKQQIGKDDCCIDVKLLRGSDRDLRSKLWRPANLQQGVMPTHRLIFSHISASLTQKPDWCDIYRLAQAGAEEALGPGHRATGWDFANGRAPGSRGFHVPAG